MKKIILFLVVVFMFNSICFAADEAQVVASFKEQVKTDLTPIIATYMNVAPYIQYNNFNNTYKKVIILCDGNYTIDVEKTNSLITPYIGTAMFYYTKVSTQSYKDKESALNDDKYVNKDIIYFKVIYSYQDDKWAFKKVMVKLNDYDWGDSKKHLSELAFKE